MTPRAKARLLLLLLALGLGYRLFAAYPLQLERFAPASSALQAMHILHGERPIFYSGQAWMGPAGAYIIAAMFKLFGASTLTLGAFSWLVSALFLVGTVLLARRLFGVDNALVAAALFAVPVDYLMNLSGQP
ncbi:MAG TPA: glycosyltransferase family 39 protein, partial [bacterium]